MSRGMGPLVPILIGLVIIIVVGIGIIGSGRTNLSKIFGFEKGLTEEEGVIPGTKVTEGLPTFRLSGSSTQIKEQLVNLLLSCWKFRSQDKHGCYFAEMDVPADTGVSGFMLQDLESVMRQLGQPGAADSLVDRDTWLPAWKPADFDETTKMGDRGIQAFIQLGVAGQTLPKYKICVDHNIVGQDDLFITYKLDFACET